MRTEGRRRLDMVLLGGGALAGGGDRRSSAALVGDAERVTQMWVGAELTTEGSDARSWRSSTTTSASPSTSTASSATIPGLERRVARAGRSPTAPPTPSPSVAPTFTDGRPGSKLKIGDPDTTITGRHRYRIDYALPAASCSPDGATRSLGRRRHRRGRCPSDGPRSTSSRRGRSRTRTLQPGGTGSTRRLHARGRSSPGTSWRSVEDLDDRRGRDHHGRARRVARRAPRPSPPPPLSAPPDPGVGLVLPGRWPPSRPGSAPGSPTSRLVRRSGRERVGTGGVADAAWAGGGGPDRRGAPRRARAGSRWPPPSSRRRPSSPPRRAGCSTAEQVRPEHKVAWLIQAAIDGAVDLVEEGKTGHQARADGPAAQPRSRTAFGGRDEVELGVLRRHVRVGLGADRRRARPRGRRTSGLWDPRADRRKTMVRVARRAGRCCSARCSPSPAGIAANRWGAPWLVAGRGRGSCSAGAGSPPLIRGLGAAGAHAAGLRPVAPGRVVPPVPPRVGDLPRRGGRQARRAAASTPRGRSPSARSTGGSGRSAGSTVIPAEAGLGYVHMAPMLMSSTVLDRHGAVVERRGRAAGPSAAAVAAGAAAAGSRG